MYDEIDQVKKNIDILKKQDTILIIIQSDPHQKDALLNKSLVDFYELLPDVAGSVEKYKQLVKRHIKEKKAINPIPRLALSRNFSHGFKAAQNFDVDWWIVLLGDMKITNLVGIKKIINKMIKLEKSIGFTRAVGMRDRQDLDDGTSYVKVQTDSTTDFYPQFFIVSDKFVKNGFFSEMKVGKDIASELMLGENLVTYCKENNLKVWDVCFSISDYAVPKFIDGVKFNEDRVILPGFLLGPFNWFRRVRMRLFYSKNEEII